MIAAVLLRRLAGVALVVVAATCTAWLLMHLLRPDLFAGEEGSLPVRLARYLEGVLLHGDFGRSRTGAQRPVGTLIREGLPADVQLLAGGLLVGFGGGVALAVASARRPRGVAARAVQAAAMVLLCTPVYVTGLLVLLVFGAGIGVLPGGIGIPTQYVAFGEDPLRWLGSLVVPWIVLGAPLGALCERMLLSQLHEVSDAEHVRTARAKGLSEATIRRRHVLPVALTPTVALAGSAAPLMLTNLVLVERVFSVPGVFSQVLQAVGTANAPLIFGMTAVGALLTTTTSLLFDLVLWLDPRVRFAAR